MQARRSARLAEARLDEEQWDALQAQLRRIQGTLVALAEEQPNIIEVGRRGSCRYHPFRHASPQSV